MQENHLIFDDAKDDSANSPVGEIASNLPNAATKQSALGHADRPAELNFLDIPADNPPIGHGQLDDPISDRTVACCR
jgi:hypothetical protein